MSVCPPLFTAGKERSGLERLTVGCGALPHLPRKDTLGEMVVLHHQAQLVVS